MNIHEYQAKRMLSRNGIKIPKGRIAYTADEARRAAKEVTDKGPWMLKAQIQSGARAAGHFLEEKAGSRGGIRQVERLRDLWAEADAMLGSTLVTKQTGPRGKLVSRLYVEAYTRVGFTFYAGMAIDRAQASVTLACRLMNRGKADEAEGLFRSVVDAGDPTFSGFATMCLGDIARAKKDNAAAGAFYRELAEKFPSSAFALQSGGYLLRKSLFDIQSPVRIEPAVEQK